MLLLWLKVGVIILKGPVPFGFLAKEISSTCSKYVIESIIELSELDNISCYPKLESLKFACSAP